MSNEYPKALYAGNTKRYQYEIANDQDHEHQLREQGYVNYSELKEPEVVVVGKASNSNTELTEVKKELLDALKSIEIKDKELQEKDEEILNLQSAYIAENNKLRQQIRQLELSKLDAGELRKILDEKQIKYGSRDGKDELVKLVFDSEYPVETQEE